MINTLGSFSAISIVLWLLLSFLFTLLYPLIRGIFFALHPRFGSALLLAYWLGPFILSIISTSFLFVPDLEGVLVDAHCHDACTNHVPLIHSLGLASFGLAVGGLIFVYLAWRCVNTLRQSHQLKTQFRALANYHGAYHLLGSSTPLVFTLGWWKPRIYLSEGLSVACTDNDLSIILLHEQAHQDRRDNLRLLLARLSGAIFNSFLAIRVMSDLQLLTEQACDFRAAERFGHVAVAQTLLKVRRLMSVPNTDIDELRTAFAERDVEMRIKALLKAQYRIALRPWQVTVLASALLISLTLMISPLHHGSEWVITKLSSPNVHIH